MSRPSHHHSKRTAEAVTRRWPNRSGTAGTTFVVGLSSFFGSVALENGAGGITQQPSIALRPLAADLAVELLLRCSRGTRSTLLLLRCASGSGAGTGIGRPVAHLQACKPAGLQACTLSAAAPLPSPLTLPIWLLR